MTTIRTFVQALGKMVLIVAVAFAFILGMVGTVYLSLRSPEVRVPEVVSQNRWNAESALDQAGLHMRVRATRFVRGTQPDTVLNQSPQPGEVVKYGQTVAVVVSRGPDKDEEASAAAASAAEAEAAKQTAAAAEEAKNDNKNANDRGVKNRNVNRNKNSNNANVNANNRNANANQNANRNANANANANKGPATNRNANANANNANRNTGNANRRVNITPAARPGSTARPPQ